MISTGIGWLFSLFLPFSLFEASILGWCSLALAVAIFGHIGRVTDVNDLASFARALVQEDDEHPGEPYTPDDPIPTRRARKKKR